MKRLLYQEMMETPSQTRTELLLFNNKIELGTRWNYQQKKIGGSRLL